MKKLNIAYFRLDSPDNLHHWLKVAAKRRGIFFKDARIINLESMMQESFEDTDVVVLPGFGPNWAHTIFDGWQEAPGEINALHTERVVLCAEKALSKGIPVFGVCGGFQLLAGMYGMVRKNVHYINAEVIQTVNKIAFGADKEKVATNFSAAHSNGCAMVIQEIIVPGIEKGILTRSKAVLKQTAGIINPVTSFIGSIPDFGDTLIGGVQFHPEYLAGGIGMDKYVESKYASKFAFALFEQILMSNEEIANAAA